MAPNAGRNADVFPEGRGKMALIGKAARERDVCEACLGTNQTALGRFDTKHDQILVRRHSRRLLERSRKMLAGKPGHFSQVLQRNVFREVFGHEVAGAALKSGGLSSRHLRRACDFMAEYFAEDISLEDLAKVTGLTSKHFARAFKQSTGMPPHQYLIMLRIEAAKRRLIGTKASLADIALACGFADQSHFTSTFRKNVGVSPGIWRHSYAK